jgi:hypothetical protein
MKLNPKTLKLTFKKGDIVDLTKKDTPEERLTQKLFKEDYLFEYFKQLSTGQTGYGISFIGWLSVAKGWTHIGYHSFRKGS